MTDNLTPEQRKRNMSLISSKNTKPEIVVRKFLHSKGYRFRLHNKKLPSKPDIVLSKYKAVINVNGCFWHMHGCSKSNIPKSNVSYWTEKLNMNKERDKLSTEQLRSMGWKVIIVWECEIKDGSFKEKLLRELELDE